MEKIRKNEMEVGQETPPPSQAQAQTPCGRALGFDPLAFRVSICTSSRRLFLFSQLALVSFFRYFIQSAFQPLMV